MPCIVIETWPTKKEMKKKMVEKITNALVELGMSPNAINIVIHESEKENWSTAGVQHSISFN